MTLWRGREKLCFEVENATSLSKKTQTISRSSLSQVSVKKNKVRVINSKSIYLFNYSKTQLENGAMYNLKLVQCIWRDS